MGILLFFLSALAAAGQSFVGGSAGIATLSGDGAARISSSSSATAQYQPRNGLAIQIFGGRHLRNYFSIQGAFNWNRNQLSLIGLETGPSIASSFEQPYRARQLAVGIDGMIYFRKRGERFRPYVSGGAGWVHASGRVSGAATTSGTPQLPASEFAAHKPFWRTAVGIDIALKSRWHFRYSFWETVTTNPFSSQFRPQGRALLLNFQNQFGLLREF